MARTPINDALFLQACEALLTFEGRPVEVSIQPLDGPNEDGIPSVLATLTGVLGLIGRDRETIACSIGGDGAVLSVSHRVSLVNWDASTGDPLLHFVTVGALVTVGPPTATHG